MTRRLKAACAKERLTLVVQSYKGKAIFSLFGFLIVRKLTYVRLQEDKMAPKLNPRSKKNTRTGRSNKAIPKHEVHIAPPHHTCHHTEMSYRVDI